MTRGSTRIITRPQSLVFSLALVLASGLFASAVSAEAVHSLTYVAGTCSSIVGTTPQTVAHGADGTAVTAVPSVGYHFVKWTDDVMTASRLDTNVTADLLASASCEPDVPGGGAGTAGNVTGWGWSGSIGWIAMNSETVTVGYEPAFGVTLMSNPATPGYADLDGYAWSENVGWICFGATCTGTTPEGGTPYAQYRANWNAKADQVYGWAKVVSWDDAGWISLNCDHDAGADECVTSNYYVVFDTATGKFVKGLEQSWAWGTTDGTIGAGWINLSSVSTSWVPAQLGRIVRPEGVYEPDNTGLIGTHLTSFEVNFVGVWATTGQRVECDLLRPDGSTETFGKTLPGAVRNGLTGLTRTIASNEVVQANKLWYLTGCRIGETAGSTVCAADAACAPTGFCDETLGRCRTTVASVVRKLPIYTHSNDWTGLEADEDQYAAVKCFAGFPDSYFKNPGQCDFAGDASFALMMRRGMPLEGNCADSLDNDGNGLTDCADPYCKGVSYRCQVRPRTTCVWGRADDGIADCSESGYATGDLCCNRQPVSEGATAGRIVDGLECTYNSDEYGNNDGYFDCDCVGTAKFNESATDDCFAPGVQTGDLCCDTDDSVRKE